MATTDKHTRLNLLQRIWLEVLWQLARFFAILPYWFKYYVVETLMFVLLCYCLRYRRSVVNRNLRNSFPEKSERERAVLRRKFYWTLSELFIDTVDLAHMTPAKGRRILRVKGLEEHLSKVEGRDWIAMTAHFGCWEYCSFWSIYAPSQIVVAVYHPLESRLATGGSATGSMPPRFPCARAFASTCATAKRASGAATW